MLYFALWSDITQRHTETHMQSHPFPPNPTSLFLASCYVVSRLLWNSDDLSPQPCMYVTLLACSVASKEPVLTLFPIILDQLGTFLSSVYFRLSVIRTNSFIYNLISVDNIPLTFCKKLNAELF